MSEYPIATYYKECSFCGRRILVQEILIGAPHTLDVAVTCAECLKKHGINEAYIKDHPEDAGRIQEWIDKEEKKVD